MIYTESHFRDQTSHAGAKGLMQITPETAKFIAHLSVARPSSSRTSRPRRSTSPTGAYYLRYLIDRYGGNEVLALAAYNGGEGNVDRWIGKAGAEDRSLRVEDIPFPRRAPTSARSRTPSATNRDNYADQLGL